MISPDDLVRRVAGGLKEPNTESFQETFTPSEGSDQTPVPVPSTVETARRERPESISGKFTMVEKVGTGGAGEVWKAWDESIHRWVALKFLKNEEEFNLQLFRREARMVGRLSHPHIIPIHEMGILGKHHYIAMKFVEGATLREYVRQDVRLIAGLLRDAAEALQYAHENDVIHRDIKPTNFLVEEHSSTRPTDTPPRTSRLGHHIYVADFGLAKQVSVDSSLSISGNLIGTPAYMSPEQANGKSELIDARTDIYSLGATLYELLFGHPPFAGNTIYDLLKAIMEEEPPSLRKKYPGIDRDLETIVMKCLRKEPENRYRTAGDLAVDLDCYLQQEPLEHARPVTFGYRMRKRIQKQPLLWAISAALLLSVLAGSGFGIHTLLERQRIEREAREKSDKALLRAQSLTDARRAFQLGEGDERLLAILEKAEKELAPDAFWLTEAGRILYETDNKELQDHARRFLEKATTLDTKRAYEALYYLYLIETRNSDIGWTKSIKTIVERAEKAGDTDNVFLYISRAREAEKAGDLQRALDYAKRAKKKGSKIFVTWSICGYFRWKTGDPDGAIEDFTKAVEIKPKDAISWSYRGDVYFEEKNFEKAIEDYTRSLSIRSDKAWVWFYRGYARLETKDLDSAIKDFTQAIKRDPEQADFWKSRGIAFFRKGNFEEAVADYSKALELSPNDSDILNNRGNARRKNGDLEGAIKDLSRAIVLSPDGFLGWLNRGLTFKDKKEWDNAVADLTRATEIDPSKASVWVDLGLALDGKGEQKEAFAAYSRAIQLDPKLQIAWYTRGVHRIKKGDLKGAIEDFTQGVTIDPDFEKGWCNRGIARLTNKDFDGAIEDFNRAIEIDPSYVIAWDQRGNARRSKGEFETAIADHTRAIELDENYARGWYHRGLAYRKLKNYEKALRDFTKAIEIAPEKAILWYARAITREDADNPKGAFSDYNQALKLDPNDVQSLLNRGLLRATYGDLPGGISDLERLLRLAPDHPQRRSIQTQLKRMTADLEKKKEN